MKPLKLAYIGTSPITEECLEASLHCPEIQPCALLSRSPERGGGLARKYAVPHVFPSLEELCQSGAEAVYIASPNILHYEQAKALLHAGKHLLVEKPFTGTFKQAQELAVLASQRGLTLMEAVIPAHCPNFERLRSFLPKLGQISGAEFSFGKVSSKWAAFQRGEHVNVFTPEMGGGSLMDLGVYSLWMMAALLGKPKFWVHTPEMLPTGVDGKGVLQCTYPSFEVKIIHSKISEEGSFFEIRGEYGALSCKGFSKMDSIFFTPEGGAVQNISVPQESRRMAYELKQFAGAVRSTAPIPPYCSLEISLDVMEILTSARRASGIIFPDDLGEGFIF